MAQFNDKFETVKTLIGSANYSQAQDECDNGISISAEAKTAGENFKGKFADAGVSEGLLEDFQAYLNHYFG